MSREVGSRELARLLDSISEVVHEDEELNRAMFDQDYKPAEEAERLKQILSRSIEDYRRFYIRRSLAEERTLSARQVADRYGLTEQWVYHCLELQHIAFKVGKYLRYRESDLVKFEKARAAKQETERKGYRLHQVIGHATESTTTGNNRIKFLAK